MSLDCINVTEMHDLNKNIRGHLIQTSVTSVSVWLIIVSLFQSVLAISEVPLLCDLLKAETDLGDMFVSFC